MLKYDGKSGKLIDFDHNSTVGKFDRYYRKDRAYKLRNSRKWWSTRDETLERDKHLCVACRLAEQPFYNAYKLEVHHLLDVKDCIKFKREDLVYSVGNCITLCQYHHRQVHSGELKLLPILEKVGLKIPEV